MSARQKLNQSYFLGSLLLAGLIGWATQTWLAFFGALVVLVASNLYGKEIRLAKRRKRDPTH
jgi:hypothetical protein